MAVKIIILVTHGCSLAQINGTETRVFPVNRFSLENMTAAAGDGVLSEIDIIV